MIAVARKSTRKATLRSASGRMAGIFSGNGPWFCARKQRA